MTRTLHMDYETASEVDLRKTGMHVYAAHWSTRILMLSWAFDDDPVQLWEPHKCALPPTELIAGLNDPAVICEAANAPFERLITFYKLGISVAYERWRCVLVKAYYLGFAGTLDQILSQVGLPSKDPRGHRLISKFCSPAPKNHKATWYGPDNAPEDWQAFCEYCVTDTEVERRLSHWLDRFPGIHEWDWRQWFVDQRVNDRGVPLDVHFATRAVEIWQEERARLEQELISLTGLAKVTRDPFLGYINSLLSVKDQFENLSGDYVASRKLKGNLPQWLVKLLDLWQLKEAKATTKYNAVLNCVSPDGRARGMFQYKGASRTDRVGGRRLQLQNLKRPIVKPEQIQSFIDTLIAGNREKLKADFDVNVSEALGGAIRHVIAAPPGRKLVVADLSSIESVLLGWLTDCPLINHTFRSGRDSYKVFGSQYYGIPYDNVTKEQRTFCKPPVLGCGYMLGWAGLIAYAEGYGVEMEEDQARRAVDTFRGMYPEVKQFWYWLYDAIKRVVWTGQPEQGYRLYIERDVDFLRIRLPSGRNLSYFKPEIVPMPAPWDYSQTIENFTYMGMNDSRQWIRDSAHAGGVTENIIQSIASDILWHGIVNGFNAGLDIILHVHDEIGAESDAARAEYELALLKQIMTTTPAWAPDLWLGADGFITDRYTKD